MKSWTPQIQIRSTLESNVTAKLIKGIFLVCGWWKNNRINSNFVWYQRHLGKNCTYLSSFGQHVVAVPGSIVPWKQERWVPCYNSVPRFIEKLHIRFLHWGNTLTLSALCAGFLVQTKCLWHYAPVFWWNKAALFAGELLGFNIHIWTTNSSKQNFIF